MDLRAQVAAAVAAMAVSLAAFGHGGGLDAQGCHHERRTGGYHCHGAQVTGGSESAPKKLTSPGPDVGRPVCHIGPRGGRYTITPSGRKNYKGC